MISTETQSDVCTIAQRIRDQREKMNYTQAYIARKLGISQNAYSKIESAHTNFSVKRLYEIANIFGIPVAEFFK